MGGDNVKGFAVALVHPPQEVAGCPALCVAMGHVPHPGHAIDGHGEIASVCGGAEQNCMIMMADWNTDDVSGPWGTLVGGSPVLSEPHEVTCCLGGWCCVFDHTVTNIQGAYSAGYKVYDAQLTKFSDHTEHKPTSVQLMLPTGGSPAVPATTTLPPIDGYTAFPGKNCFNGHGGEEISGAMAVASDDECKSLCDQDDACDCVTSDSQQCWKRASCEPSQFLADDGYTTFVKSQPKTMV